MPSTQTVNFGPFKQGQTVEDIDFTILIDAAPPVSPISDVALSLRRNQLLYQTYDSNTGDITITGAGEFTIDKHIIDYPAQEYDYDLKIEFTDGDIKYFIEGKWDVRETFTA